ncbi:MAG: hypothetical protein BGO98_17005 [Myxococcales bacterium 68-20]|nr:MAG: hypothetical protein BGO98_17005 [Myxococcales bacterium 68-20]
MAISFPSMLREFPHPPQTTSVSSHEPDGGVGAHARRTRAAHLILAARTSYENYETSAIALYHALSDLPEPSWLTHRFG